MDEEPSFVHRAQDRHQMEDVARPAPVGGVHAQDLDLVPEERRELPQTLVVRAVGAGHRQGAPVEPGDVATLEGARRLDAAADGNVRLGKEGGERVRLPAALALPHAADDHAAVGRDRGVARVERVERRLPVRRQEAHRHPGLQEEPDEMVVVEDGAPEIGRRGVPQPAPLAGDALAAAESVARMLEDHRRERQDLRLAGLGLAVQPRRGAPRLPQRPFPRGGRLQSAALSHGPPAPRPAPAGRSPRRPPSAPSAA